MPMVRRLLSLLISGLAALWLGAGGAEARKLALIIGNNAYANLDSLDKAVAERFPDAERKVIRTAMRLHTASTRYLKAMEKATHRYDLEGNEAGEVSEEHRQHAAQTLKERFAEASRRKREQQQKEREAQREAEAERRKTEKLQQLLGRFSRS